MHRMKHWVKISRGIGEYRYALWPFQIAAARSADIAGGKVAKLILGAHPRPDESKEALCRRRNTEIKSLVSEAHARPSDHWALKVVIWLEHLARHPGCLAPRLLQEQTPLWLETCRVLSGRSLFYESDAAGVTMTRAGQGRPTRYLGAWWQSMNFSNPDKIKRISKYRAGMLKRFVLGHS